MNAAPLKAKLAIPLACVVAYGAFLTYEGVAELREFRSFEEAMTLANVLDEANEADIAELGNA